MKTEMTATAEMIETSHAEMLGATTIDGIVDHQ